MLIKFVLIILYFSFSIQQLSIMTPTVLKNTFLQLYPNTGGMIEGDFFKNSAKNNGKSLRGYLYYSSDNDLCDSNSLPNLDPSYYNNFDVPDNSIFFLVNESNQCTYSKQALNAKIKGARMLIISIKNESEPKIDIGGDIDKDKVNIPIYRVKSTDASIIEEYALNNSILDITMNIEFDENTKPSVIVDFYLRSDNPKAIYFFDEFKPYYYLLQKHIRFFPYFKYYECLHCIIDQSIDEKPLDSCIRSNQSCGYTSDSKFLF